MSRAPGRSRYRLWWPATLRTISAHGLNWGYLTLLQSITAGARAVLLDRFSGRAALELTQRERVTFIPSAPASIIAMLNDPELTRFDLSSLRVVITGGASCPIETIRAYRAHMPGHLIELYGMLETGFHAHAEGGGTSRP